MSHRSPTSFAFTAAWRPSLLLLLAMACPAVYGQTPGPGQVLTRTADDSGITWAACPPFLPAGCGIAVLHGDPSKDNVDVFLRVPGKSVLPPHWHSSAERMVLTAGELHVTYDGQETAILRAGTYAYGPARLPHKGYCASDVPCVLFIAFESPLDAVPVAGTGN